MEMDLSDLDRSMERRNVDGYWDLHSMSMAGIDNPRASIEAWLRGLKENGVIINETLPMSKGDSQIDRLNLPMYYDRLKSFIEKVLTEAA